MKSNSKTNTVRLCIYASIIAAVLVAISVVLPSIADSAKDQLNNGNEEIEVSATKTAQWNDDTYSHGTITITAECQGRGVYVPDVLFIGTMCSAHSLTTQTVTNSLNAIANTSNVDYFMFNNNGETHATPDTSGTIQKGETLINPITISDVSNHQAMGKFLQCIYDQHNNHLNATGKGYDFIVLEFDGTRISDWYRNLKPEGDSSNINGTYNKFDHESEVVEILKDYYANKQVIWITDSTEGYKPTRNMHVRNANYLTRKINYNTLKGMLAPTLYYPVTDTSSMTVDEITSYENTLPDSINEDVPNEYILGEDRQVSYSQSEQVGKFLEKAIKDLFVYTLVINDKIHLDKNLKITTNSVKLYSSDTGTEGTWTQYSGHGETITIGDDGNVRVEVPNLEGKKYFKLDIGFEDKSSEERFIDVSPDGDPNDGHADVEVIPDAGEKKVDDPETNVPLDWEIPIYYEVEEAYKETPGISVDNDLDTITTAASSKPEGSEAQETTRIRFQYWSAVIDGVPSFVSADYKFVPEPDETTNRYVTRTYVAHFAEVPEETKRLTVSKVWSDGDDFHLNDQIVVHMFAEDVDLGSFVMNADTDWTYITKYDYQIYNDATDLPINYSFKEEPFAGYEASYVVEKDNPKTSGNTVITNTYAPGPEPGPTPTPDPGNVSPAGHSPVKTDDITNLMALGIVAGMGLICILVVSRVKSRKDKKRG